jgi:hypothetical protein
MIMAITYRGFMAGLLSGQNFIRVYRLTSLLPTSNECGRAGFSAKIATLKGKENRHEVNARKNCVVGIGYGMLGGCGIWGGSECHNV